MLAQMSMPGKEIAVTQRLRLKFSTTAIVKRAIKLRAALEGTSQEAVVNNALVDYLEDQVDEVVERGLVSDPVTVVTAQKASRAAPRQPRG